jgi:osmotically-inducible protein OsmY
MISRKVRNVMTHEVITVDEARRLARHRIKRLPVDDGVVTLVGQVERQSLVPIIVHLTRTVPGVVDVVNRLTFQLEDERPLRATYSMLP